MEISVGSPSRSVLAQLAQRPADDPLARAATREAQGHARELAGAVRNGEAKGLPRCGLVGNGDLVDRRHAVSAAAALPEIAPTPLERRDER